MFKFFLEKREKERNANMLKKTVLEEKCVNFVWRRERNSREF